MENVIQSKVIGRDVRVTSTPSGLWIEVLDGETEPIRLTCEQLAEFGLYLSRPDERRVGHRQNTRDPLEVSS